VALLTAEASNQFLEALHQLNGALLVSYKPLFSSSANQDLLREEQRWRALQILE